MKKIRKVWNKLLKPGKPDTKRVFRFSVGSRGFTLTEAIIATTILAVGLVGLQAAMRRGLVSSVRAWDKVVKTNIAMTRLEEHKAQLYASYTLNTANQMVLPVIKPTPPSGATTVVNFASGSITYTANVRLSIDAVNNAVVSQTGYGVVFPTPAANASYYYGDVNPNTSPTPNYAWADFKRTNDCDTTLGNIYFNITTPPKIKGMLNFSVVDYKGLERSQRIYVGASSANLGPGATPISTGTATPVSFPISELDTTSGTLNIRIAQTGGANDWGFPIEDGAVNINSISISPSVPTPTATSSTCPLNICTPVSASSFVITSGFSLSGSSPNQYFRPNSTGSAYYNYTVSCPGMYIARAYTESCFGSTGCNNNLRVTLTNSGGTTIAPITGTPAPGAAPITWWVDNTGYAYNTFQDQTINHGSSFPPSPTPAIPVTWLIGASGTYRLTFFPKVSAATTRVPYVQNVCLSLVGYTPTNTPVTPPATPTPTSTPIFSFAGTPEPLTSGFFGVTFVGTPGYQSSSGYLPYGCDTTNNSVLKAQGKTNADGIVNWETGPITYVLDANGKVYANIRLMPSMWVTMGVQYNGASTLTSAVTAAAGGVGGWYQPPAISLSSGQTITNMFYNFRGGSSAVTNYLAVDSVRVMYNNALNPNALISGATLAVLDSYRDTSTFKDFVVDSSVQPMQTPGSSTGYQVEVVVRNAKNGVPIDTFLPVTIVNSVSP